MKKKLSVFSLTLLFMSCSHRVQQTQAVHFPYANELLVQVQSKNAHRRPASNLEITEEKSNRRVYFSSLYHQYLTLAAHLGKEQDINFCPQFHHDKIETDALPVPKISLWSSALVEEEGRDYFPELAFNRNFSLFDYHASLKQELSVLCEDGVSDNYYKFDNLVTHYAGKNSFHMAPKAMESVLKIPIFANYYLIEMLKSEGEELVTHGDKKFFILLSRTHWFDQYVSEATVKRSQFLRNRVVRKWP